MTDLGARDVIHELTPTPFSFCANANPEHRTSRFYSFTVFYTIDRIFRSRCPEIALRPSWGINIADERSSRPFAGYCYNSRNRCICILPPACDRKGSRSMGISGYRSSYAERRIDCASHGLFTSKLTSSRRDFIIKTFFATKRSNLLF